jgi:hypothetical protein
VPAAELLLAAAAGLLAVALIAGRAGRLASASATRALADAIPEALGDAALLVDERGVVVWASETFSRIAGPDPRAHSGRALETLSIDLPVLMRGLSRGPASGIVSLRTRAGDVRARAALVRISRKPPRDVVVLRPLTPPALGAAPTAATAPTGTMAVEAAEPPAGDGPGVSLAGIPAALHGPIERATRAASMLRLVAPPLAPRAEEALAVLERALEDAERRLTTLALAGRLRAERSTVDLASMVEDVALGIAPRSAIRISLGVAAGRALVDERALRSALRELLGALAAAGRALSLVATEEEGRPAMEIEVGAADVGEALSLARALLAPQGGRIEETVAAGRGRVVRIVLAAAPPEPLEPAPERAPEAARPV